MKSVKKKDSCDDIWRNVYGTVKNCFKKRGGRKTFFKFSALLISILFSLLIASCAGGAGGGGAGADADETSLAITVPDFSSTSKTLYNASDITSITATITSSSYSNTKSANRGETMRFSNIPAGDYSVVAYGKTSDGKVAAKGTASVTIKSGETTTTTIHLSRIEHFTVSFKNGATLISSQEVSQGYKVSKPADPVSPTAGLYFVNWYSDNDLTSIFNFNTAINADIDVYAKFDDVHYTVTLNYNGGQDASGNTSHSDTYAYNDHVTEPTVTKTGYTHIGWATSADAPIEDVITSIPDVTGNATYYAKWQATQYIIHYNFTHAAQTTPADVVFFTIEDTPVSSSFPPIIPNTNYELKGWYDNSSFTGTPCTGVSIPAGTIGDVNYYAKVGLITADITFNFNGGKNSANETSKIIEGEYTQSPTAPTGITRTGYTLSGWATSSTATTALASLPAVTGTATYYAVWSPISYSISASPGPHANLSSSDIPVGSYTIEDQVTALPTAHPWAGYEFVGWYRNSSYTGEPVTVIPRGSTGDITLYARCDPKEYTITLNAGSDGSVSPTSITFTYGDPPTLPSPTPNSSTRVFAGWYEDASFSGSEVISYTRAADVTLYAKYEIPWTIMFNYNGGTDIDGRTALSSYVRNGGAVLCPLGITKTGYTFVGWSTSSTATTAITVPPATADVTYYAVWQAE